MPPPRSEAFLTNPIGTAAYKVDSFKENDQVIYVINENYREPNKPYFATINLKGGGEASSAAQAVLQTGDWDYAWNMQVEPQILKQLEESGGKGTVLAAPPTNVERINFNFSDPEHRSRRRALESAGSASVPHRCHGPSGVLPGNRPRVDCQPVLPGWRAGAGRTELPDRSGRDGVAEHGLGPSTSSRPRPCSKRLAGCSMAMSA